MKTSKQKTTIESTNATLLNGNCQGLADCFQGKVTEVVDGDTLDVNNVRIGAVFRESQRWKRPAS